MMLVVPAGTLYADILPSGATTIVHDPIGPAPLWHGVVKYKYAPTGANSLSSLIIAVPLAGTEGISMPPVNMVDPSRIDTPTVNVDEAVVNAVFHRDGI